MLAADDSALHCSSVIGKRRNLGSLTSLQVSIFPSMKRCMFGAFFALCFSMHIYTRLVRMGLKRDKKKMHGQLKGKGPKNNLRHILQILKAWPLSTTIK